MKHFIPIESAIMDDNRICELINRHGMKGYGAYIVLLIELRNRQDYVCTMESLRLISRKCRTTPEFLQSVVMDFDLFEVNKSASDGNLISSPYVNRVMVAYDEKVKKCRQAGKESARIKKEREKQHPLKSVATKEKKIKEKNNHSNDYSYANNHLNEKDYPYEIIDPVTGERSVDGKVIPSGAPPRPRPNAVWSSAKKCWT